MYIVGVGGGDGVRGAGAILMYKYYPQDTFASRSESAICCSALEYLIKVLICG